MIDLLTEIELKRNKQLALSEFSPFSVMSGFPSSASVNGLFPYSFYFQTKHIKSYGAIAEIPAGSNSSNFLKCIQKAKGEALERYASCFCDLNMIVKNTKQGDLPKGNVLVDLEQTNLFLPWQYNKSGFPYVAWNKELKTDWVPARSILENTSTYLPLSMCHFGNLESSNKLQDNTTNGVAAGSDDYSALLSALLELIERDAFMFYWRSFVKPLKLKFEDLPAEFLKYCDKLLGTSYSNFLSIFYLPTDFGVPVVMAVIQMDGSDSKPRVTIGACANPLIDQALYRALDECVGIFYYQFSRHRQNRFDSFISDQNTANYFDDLLFTFDEHSDIYAFTDMSLLFKKWLSGAETIDYSLIKGLDWNRELLTSEAQMMKLTSLLKDHGFHVYGIDLTTRDVKAQGLSVWRVVVPGLLQIEATHKYRFLGGNRVLSLGKKIGLTNRLLSPDDLNQFPHPFP